MSLTPASLALSKGFKPIGATARFGDYHLNVDHEGQYTGTVNFTERPVDATALTVETRPAHEPDTAPQSHPMQLRPLSSGLMHWTTGQPINLNDKGLDYRILKTDALGKTSPLLDGAYTPTDGWHRIVPEEIGAAHKQGPILNLFQSSVMPSQVSKAQESLRDPLQVSRSHFTDFRDPRMMAPDARTGEAPPSNLAGLIEAMDKFDPRATAYRNLLLAPFTGGDPSIHGYWSADLFALNPTVNYDPAQYRQLVGQAVRRDMKLISDVATNVGLASLPVWSNLLYGRQSPSWNFFKFDREPRFGPFPRVFSDDKLTLGVLPTRVNPQTSLPEFAPQHLGIRIIHPPDNGRFAREPYLQFYDPALYTPEGALRPYGPERADYTDPIRKSSDSIYEMCFPLPAKQLARKLAALKSEGVEPAAVNGQLVFSPDSVQGNNARWQQVLTQTLLDWPNFRFDTPDKDNSGMKWHGQVNAVKLNLVGNPEVRDQMAQSLAYTVRLTRNNALDLITTALTQQQAHHPQATPEVLLQDITASDSKTPVSQRPAHQVLGPVSNAYSQFEDPAVIAARADYLRESDEFKPVPRNRTATASAKTLVREVPIGVVPLRLENGYPLIFKTTLQAPAMAKKLAEPTSLLGRTGMLTRNLLSLTVGLGADTSPLRSFEAVLKDELKRAISGLPDDAKTALQTPLTQSVAMGRLGPDLYTYLLTGKTQAEGRDAVVQGFYDTVPQQVRNSDPLTGPQLVQGFLKKRLQSPETRQWLAERLANSLQTQSAAGEPTGQWMNPDHVRLAKAVLDNREYGLNLRLDAAKELADTDRINNAHPVQRDAIAQLEVERALDTWKKILEPSRLINPKMTVVAEWTNDTPKTAWATDYLKDTFNGVFDTMMNFRYAYARIMSLAHRLPRTDGFDDEGTLTMARAVSDIQSMTQSLPRPVVQSIVNLASVHDNEPLTANALINSALRESDYLPRAGLKDQLADGLMELVSKPPFAQARALIAPGSLPQGWQDKLATTAQALAVDIDTVEPEQAKALTQRLHHWIDAAPNLTRERKEDYKIFATKAPDAMRPKDFSVTLAELALNPKDGLLGDLKLGELAQTFGEHVYQALKQTCIQPTLQGIAHPGAVLDERLHDDRTWQPLAQQLILTGQGEQLPRVKSWVALKALVAGRIAESSEVKANRAMLSNALEADSFPWSTVLAGKNSADTRQAVKTGLYQAFNWMAALDQRSAGALSLQGLFNRLIDDPRGLTRQLDASNHPGLAHDEDFKARLIANLHTELLTPAIPKVLTGIAIAASIPGQPSFVASQDGVFQTGNERYTNDYLNNREQSPLHRFKSKGIPDGERSRYSTAEADRTFDAAQKKLHDTLTLGERFPAMRNGFVVPMHSFSGPDTGKGPDEARLNRDDVLITARSNDQQLVVHLVNTHKPDREATNWNTLAGRIGTGARYPEAVDTQPTLRNWSVDLKGLDLPEGSQFVSYHDNDPAKGIAQTYRLHKGKITGLNLDDQLVLELVKVPHSQDKTQKVLATA